MNRFNRRELAQMAGGCAALTNASLLSTLFNLSATNTAMAAAGDMSGYKAMVCLFLFGGNDSFNMLVPRGTGEYADYLQARGGMFSGTQGPLGLNTDDLHPIVDSASGRLFGVHPAMPEVQQLYNDNKLTFLCNIGSLVEPTDMTAFQQRSNLPLGLFSHADLQRHWMTSVPQTRSQVTGWAGRMADLINGSTNSNPTVSMNIALNSVNMLQTGGSVVPYVIGSNGATEVSNYFQPWTRPTILRTLSEDAYSLAQNNLLERTFAKVNKNSVEAAEAFNVATKSAEATEVDSHFPTGGGTALQQHLRMVARTIRVHSQLGQQRQVFFVSHNGYDLHDGLFAANQPTTVGPHAGNLQQISQALGCFQSAMDAIGMGNDVVLFTASDFARTLNSNGRGSDHAWGGNQIVMGGGVNGLKLHGEFPQSLALGNPLDLGRGRLLPTTSVDEMACELAMWYGLPNDNNMEVILPNIRNFHGLNDNSYPIGFMS